MAMETHVHMVTDAQIAALEASPESVNELDEAGGVFETYLSTAIGYFLTGSAYPDEGNTLAAPLWGERSIDTPTLENGAFGVVASRTVPVVCEALSKIDMQDLRKRAEEADLDVLEDEEEVDVDLFVDSEDPVGEIVRDIEELQQFVAQAAGKKMGLMVWTG